MSRIVIMLIAFILGVCIVAAFAAPALPPDRDDCRIVFVEVDMNDPELSAFQVYAPLYLCRRTRA